MINDFKLPLFLMHTAIDQDLNGRSLSGDLPAERNNTMTADSSSIRGPRARGCDLSQSYGLGWLRQGADGVILRPSRLLKKLIGGR